MDNRPIGIFDSGLGGLTALKAFRELMPQEDIIYFGDTGRVPYGSRPAAQLRVMARQDLDFLADKGVKAIIAACGTVSSIAPELLAAYKLPTVGVVQAGAGELSKHGGSGPLGVIATEASISSGAYQRTLKALCPEREVIAVACPEFVPLIESGHSAPEDPLVKAAVESALRPIKEGGATALLLGCTHYGIIGAAIAEYLGAGVELVSASVSAAESLSGLLKQREMTGGSGAETYYTSGSGEDFSRLAGALLGRAGVAAREVPIMEA